MTNDQRTLEARASSRRADILARVRAATANDPVQVVGYSEQELARRAEMRATIERLQELRKLWSREDRELAAQRAVRAQGERAPILPPAPAEPAPDSDEPPPFPAPRPRVLRVQSVERFNGLLAQMWPDPEPADAEPPTMRSADSCPLSPQDIHLPFPLLSARDRASMRTRARATPADSAPPPPTAPRQRVAAPREPSTLGRLVKRLLAPLGARESAVAFCHRLATSGPRRGRPPVQATPPRE